MIGIGIQHHQELRGGQIWGTFRRLQMAVSRKRKNIFKIRWWQKDPYQSVTYQYREFYIFGGIGTPIGQNWYGEKVFESVSEKLVP